MHRNKTHYFRPGQLEVGVCPHDHATSDRWVDAPKVTLVSQVWTQLGGKLSLRKTLRWDREDERLNRECEALLDCYRQLPD